MPNDIAIEKNNRTFWLTLNRPEVKNAMRTPGTSGEIIAALHEANADSDIRCIVITGAGDAFSAGGDVKEMAKWAQGGVPDAATARQIVRQFHEMVLALYETEKPVIAMVNGPAVGAGCTLALTCDVRIASDRAFFMLAFVHRGLSSDAGSTYLLPRLAGYPRAFELLTLGDRISAETALELGMVNRVAPHDELRQATEELAARYAEAPATAVRLIKRGLRMSANAAFHDALENEATMQAICLTGAEHREGVQAFIEKRTPKF
jgi:2-(1,2-epoxy-1,2-dihydrophenyl)acetyl-CoA isomerase